MSAASPAYTKRIAAIDPMSLNTEYAAVEPTRADIDALAGPTLLEFGSPYCGHCRAAQPLLAATLGEHASVRHIKVADGSGKPLGRSFRVKLWPTLIFLASGREVGRLVRPREAAEVRREVLRIDPGDDPIAGANPVA